MTADKSELIIYQADDGRTLIETRLEDETVWLTQAQMAALFQKSRVTVTEHIRNIFDEGELDEFSVCRKFRPTGGFLGSSSSGQLFGISEQLPSTR